MKRTLFLLLPVFIFFTQCDSPTSENEVSEEDKAAEWQLYSNSAYNVAFEYPGTWKVTEREANAEGPAVIAVYPKEGSDSIYVPGVNEPAEKSFLAIYPDGKGVELPFGGGQAFGADRNLRTGFEVSDQSMSFSLGDGLKWGYYLVPSSPPNQWSEYGFVFAQIGANNSEMKCFDKTTGEEKPAFKCRPMEGDSVVRLGDIKKDHREILEKILESIDFKSDRLPSTSQIKVTSPGENSQITSPLTINGKARGTWFFEGQFPVKLMDSQGNVLEETAANANDDWMTEDMVAFTAKMSFEQPEDHSGELVFENANPSGIPDKARSYSLPVRF